MNARASMGRVWQGFSRPFTLLAGLRADAPAWRRFVLVSAVQLLLTLSLALAFVAVGEVVKSEPQEATPAAVRALQWFALLGSALVTAQWITLALTREYQAPIARALCAVAGIAPEDDEAPPRVHLDPRWLRKKGEQRLRGMLVLLPGFLAFTPIFLVTKPLGLDNFVMPPLMFGWTAYWFCAFTAGRSARAWREAAAQTPPGPIRWWLKRTESTPGFRWFIPRWMGRFGVWASKGDAAPAVAMERDPLIFMGLGLARFVTSLPLLRLFFRAAIDMAAAEALERGPRTARG